VLQAVVVEMIQRRQFVRIVSDLAHRFPRANQASMVGEYPRELANRVFDVMTIQKATAILLLDGVSIVLTTMIGLLLLAFYHPYLLGFDIVLLLSMISITWILGRGGIRTAIEESMTKYAVAHWLQDVLASPTVFKTGGGEALAVARANQLTTEYINARERQFRVVLRQIVFAVGLQVVASTVLLALGGWLVIDHQLTLGQLVASELVVTVVVGAFAKAGKSLEKYYDLMAGIGKVGHLLDIPIDPRDDQTGVEDGAAEASWSDLVFEGPAGQSKVPAANVAAGSRVAIVGDDLSGCSLLARTLAGLVEPSHGLAQIAGLDSAQAAVSDAGRLVGYVGGREIFHGSLRENIDLARIGIGQSRVREVIQQVGLSDTVLRLPDGLDTELQTDGFPLSRVQAIQLMFARVIAAKPKLLIIDRLLDELDAASQAHLWETLASPDASWTLVVVTNREDIAQRCNTQIAVRSSEVSV
jgi:putative ABC transport system ATP-binding protein